MSIKFGELALSSYWRNLNLAISVLSAIGTCAIIYTGEFLIWRSLPNLPNCQIKNLLAKVSPYNYGISYYYDPKFFRPVVLMIRQTFTF